MCVPNSVLSEAKGRPYLQVAVIGAGLAGVLAGILLPVKVPGLKLTIIEKNADVVCR